LIVTRQLTLAGGVDLAPVLAQRRGDPRQSEPPVDLLLRLRHDQLAGLGVEQAVFREFQAGVHGHFAYADVVRARAGEVLQRCTPGFGLHDAEVHLHAAARTDGGLGRSAADDLHGVRMSGEGRHQGCGVLGGGEDVHVADRVPNAPQ
jgi:hypothetical protein